MHMVQNLAICRIFTFLVLFGDHYNRLISDYYAEKIFFAFHH